MRERGHQVHLFRFDGTSLQKQCEVDVHGQYFMDEFSPQGDLLAMHTWGHHEHGVGLFDSQSGKKLREWQLLGATRGCSFSPDGSELAVNNLNGTIWVLDVSRLR